MRKTIWLSTSLLLWSSLGAAELRAADLPNAPVAPAPAPQPINAYTLNLLYTGEGWDVVSGGLRQGGSYMYNADAQFQVDTGKAFGWTGGTFEAETWFTNATSTGNTWTGALDQQSPIDTAANAAMFRIYQLFYDQNFGATDVRVGIYDLETEFSNTKPMALFLSKDLTWNTALDQAGTMPLNGTIGPGNYPYTPLALRIRESFSPSLSVQAAIANGAADNPNNLAANGVFFSPAYGAMFMGEADYTPDKHTKVMVGGWAMTSKLPDYGQTNPDGSQRMSYGEAGAYIGGATRIYSDGPKKGLDVFATFGMSTPETTNVAESLNGGLVYTGLFDWRPADKVGVSFNVNEVPSGWRQWQAMFGNPIGTTEYSFEATYRAKINDWLTIQPDVQYIQHPFYSNAVKNPLVLGIHFEIGHVFEW